MRGMVRNLMLAVVLVLSVVGCDVAVTAPLLSPAAAPAPRFAVLLGTQLSPETAVILATALPPTDTTSQYVVEWRAAPSDAPLATGPNFGRSMTLDAGQTYQVFARYRVGTSGPWAIRRYVYQRNHDGSWPSIGRSFAY